MNEIPAVEFREVNKVYPNGTKAVHQVSFRIPPGRFIALLGPSGCGKTTTLRLINRLEEPTGGTILVRGQEITRQKPEELRRSIGYVIQDGGLFPHLNVSQNVATVPRLLGWPAEQIQKRVDEVLKLVGLPEEQYGQRMPSQLSGGQRQRVGVARGLAADPDILLMDEPFGALDPGTRSTIQDEFLSLQKKLNKTIVMVTHDISEAGKLADDIVLMVSGRIVQEGSLRELLIHPANEQVRGFLGKQGHGLALESLRLADLLVGLEVREPSKKVISLTPQTTLGQTLVALADVQPETSVLVNGPSEKSYDAGELRSRILEDLRQAEEAFQ